MADTFAAIGADPEALQATISGGPPTLQAGIDLLPAQRPFLRETSPSSSAACGPGVQSLRVALPSLNGAIRVGTPVLARSAGDQPAASRGVFTQLENLVEQPTTKSSIVSASATSSTAPSRSPTTSLPAQTVCNYWNYFWTLLPEHLTERDSIGFSQRVSLIATPPGTLTLNLDLDGPGRCRRSRRASPATAQTGLSTAGYSGVQANGKYGAAPTPPTPGQFEPHELPILHAHAAAPTGQNGSDCQPGQTGYVLGQLRVPGQSRQNPAVARPRPAGRPRRHRRLLEAGRRRGSSRTPA